jgi:hypothetical protein
MYNVLLPSKKPPFQRSEKTEISSFVLTAWKFNFYVVYHIVLPLFLSDVTNYTLLLLYVNSWGQAI